MTTINNFNARFNYDAAKTKIKNPNFKNVGIMMFLVFKGKVLLNSTKYAENHIIWESWTKPLDL